VSSESKVSDALNETCTMSLPHSEKWVKGELHIFHQKKVIIYLFRKNIFPFSYVVLFAYDKWVNEGTVKFFLRNLGQFPHLPENRGT